MANCCMRALPLAHSGMGFLGSSPSLLSASLSSPLQHSLTVVSVAASYKSNTARPSNPASAAWHKSATVMSSRVGLGHMSVLVAAVSGLQQEESESTLQCACLRSNDMQTVGNDLCGCTCKGRSDRSLPQHLQAVQSVWAGSQAVLQLHGSAQQQQPLHLCLHGRCTAPSDMTVSLEQPNDVVKHFSTL